MLHLDHVCCPACKAPLLTTKGGTSAKSLNNTVICASCDRLYAVEEDIAVLLLDPLADTALDLAEYDAERPVTAERSEKSYSYYQSVIEKYNINGGNCLEIGSGTGQLTYSLVHLAPFNHIYCSDISKKFLRRLRQLVPSQGKSVSFYIFDAAALPFEDQSMRAVFGHSVLHHLLEYEAVLRDVYRVLEPGGITIFGEPTLDFHAVLSFVSDLIWRMEKTNSVAKFSHVEMQLLNGIGRQSPETARKMRTNRKELEPAEDKHMFLIDEIRSLASQIGFSDFSFSNAFVASNFGNAIKYEIITRFERLGYDPRKVSAYDFIFESATNVLGACYGRYAPCNFGYLTFVK